VLDKVIQKKPTPEPYVRRGACKKELKDNAGAQADYEQAIKLDAKYAPAYLYLGDTCTSSRRTRRRSRPWRRPEARAGTPIASQAEQTLAAIQRKK